MGQKAGVLGERRSQKWTAAAKLQPTFPKSDRLLIPALQGGHAEVQVQAGGGLAPALGGQHTQYAKQVALGGRGGKQRADDGKTQACLGLTRRRVMVWVQVGIPKICRRGVGWLVGMQATQPRRA